jgi:hypothetical protein
MNGKDRYRGQLEAGAPRILARMMILSFCALLATGCERSAPTAPRQDPADRIGALSGELVLAWPGARAATVVVSIYAGADRWAADQPLQQQTIRVVDGREQFRFDGLRTGAYLLDAWADADGDGTFDPEDGCGVFGSVGRRHFEPAPIGVSPVGTPTPIRLELRPWRAFRDGLRGVPAQNLPAEPAVDCKTWGCVKCQFNPRCAKADG